MVCIDGQCLCVCLAGVYCESRQCVSVYVCVRARAVTRAHAERRRFDSKR